MADKLRELRLEINRLENEIDYLVSQGRQGLIDDDYKAEAISYFRDSINDLKEQQRSADDGR